MKSVGQILNSDSALPLPLETRNWYAIHTYPRHEKKVVAELGRRGLEGYLPLLTKLSQWSDRRKLVELPLFPCYAFVRMEPVAEARIRVLSAAGVIGLVGAGRRGIPVPESQIEDIRALLASKMPCDAYPFLKVGQRVRVRGGSLDGLEGILVRRDGKRRLVISVESIERSLAVSIEGLEVEAV